MCVLYLPHSSRQLFWRKCRRLKRQSRGLTTLCPNVAPWRTLMWGSRRSWWGGSGGGFPASLHRHTRDKHREQNPSHPTSTSSSPLNRSVFYHVVGLRRFH